MARTICRLVDAGIDYLTVTSPVGGTTESLMEVGYGVAHDVFGDGAWESKSWAALGYRGEKLGTIGYGDGDQGGIIQCSGPTANILAGALADAGLHIRCTRIDFQCTGQWNRDCSAYAYRTGKALAKAKQGAQEGRPAKHQNIVGWGGGDTLTSGSRVSDRYIRIYDKTREQRGTVAPRLWRWEVEFHRKLAASAWELTVGGTVGPALAEGIVIGEVERRGVVVPWEKGESVEVTKPASQRSDVSRKLAWIRDQVMPTFVWLYRRGYGDTLESMIAAAKAQAEEKPGESLDFTKVYEKARKDGS